MPDPLCVTIEVAVAEGRYRPAARDSFLTLVGETAAANELAGGRALTRVEPAALAAAESGWTIHDGAVVVKLPDGPEASTIRLER